MTDFYTKCTYYVVVLATMGIMDTIVATLCTVMGAATMGRDIALAAIETVIGAPIVTVAVLLFDVLVVRIEERDGPVMSFVYGLMCTLNAGPLGQLIFRGTTETFAAVYQNAALGTLYYVAMVTIGNVLMFAPAQPRTHAAAAVAVAAPEKVFVVVEMPGEAVALAERV